MLALALHVVVRLLAAGPRRDPPPSLAYELQLAAEARADFRLPALPHDYLHHLGRYEPMGTTVAMLALEDKNACVVWVGGVPYVNYARCPVEDVPPEVAPNPGTIALYGLRFWDLGRKYWPYALKAARWLVQHQNRHGAWPVPFPVPGEDLARGWVSAMYQGAAISLLLRAYEATGHSAFLSAASRALEPFSRAYGRGGVVASTRFGPFPQEYSAASPPSVLNGGITALLGLYEYSVFTGRRLALVATVLGTLHRLLPALTLPGWACYQLSPCVPAPPFYMAVQTTQLFVLGQEFRDPVLLTWARKWEADFIGESAYAAAQLRAQYAILP